MQSPYPLPKRNPNEFDAIFMELYITNGHSGVYRRVILSQDKYEAIAELFEDDDVGYDYPCTTQDFKIKKCQTKKTKI